MNIYPLDGSALNGWGTYFISGDSAMVLDTTASGKVAKLGAATSALLMAAQGNGILADAVSGLAAMSMTASGDWKLAILPSGEAALVMSAQAAPAPVQYGAALAPMEMFASHGLPVPPVIPDTFLAAHPKGVLIVPAENTTLRVEADAQLRVRRAQQLSPVDPDNGKL